MVINKERAKKIVLDYRYSYQRERGFHIELQITDENVYEFDECFVLYVTSKDPDGIIFGNSAIVVEKKDGDLVFPRPDPLYPGSGGPVEGVMKTYRDMKSKNKEIKDKP